MKYFKKRRKHDSYEPLLNKKRKIYIKKKQEEPYSLIIKLIINFILFIMFLLISRKTKKFFNKKLSKTKVAMCVVAKRENRYLK